MVKADKVVTCLALALGPRRNTAIADYWSRLLGRSREPLPLLRIAALLASERLPDGSNGAPAVAIDEIDDPGLVAAAGYAGLTLPPAAKARYLRLAEADRHTPLIWRGLFLGRCH